VRLDHLLSKESFLVVGQLSLARSRHSQLVHWRVLSRWCRWLEGLFLVGGVVSLDFVFSSVLRELFPRAGMGVVASRAVCSRWWRPAADSVSGDRWPTLGGWLCGLGVVRGPLRTAEQARASLFLPSYKEPTVDALAPRTDEGRE
jgi:hypothetical protein